MAGAGATGASATPAPQGNAEEQLSSYVKCLRGQGLDIADPQVDADGNLRLAPPRGGGAGGGGGFNPSRFQAAQDVCGQPPAGALGGGWLNQTKFQDAALKFAQCMREQGAHGSADRDGSGLPAARRERSQRADIRQLE